MIGKYSLKQIFRKLSKVLPEATEGSKPLGAGAFGIVIEHNDLSVSKFIFRTPHPADMQFGLNGFYREIQILAHLVHHHVKDLEIPVLIGESQELYLSDFAATYKMTKLAGANSASLYKRNGTKADGHALYERAGTLMARFHAIPPENLPPIPERHGYNGHEIKVVPGLLNDRTNRALEKANAYLEEHRKAGIVHGDAGEHNYIYTNGLPSGLVDFAFCGISENQMSDFAFTPRAYMPDFIRGYQRESGQPIDDHLVSATNLSFAANQLYQLSQQKPKEPAWILYALENMNMHLNDMVYVTGFKP